MRSRSQRRFARSVGERNLRTRRRCDSTSTWTQSVRSSGVIHPSMLISAHTLLSIIFGAVFRHTHAHIFTRRRIKWVKGITAPRLCSWLVPDWVSSPARSGCERNRRQDTHRLGVCQSAQVDWLPYGKHHTPTAILMMRLMWVSSVLPNPAKKQLCVGGLHQKWLFSHFGNI